jgi:iron complex outermembrane receptor protein
MRTATAIGLVLACAAAASAQDAPDQIVVTSTPLGVTTDEITGSVVVVDDEHIKDRLAGSLADTIAHEPGVSSTFFGPAASRPVIRGLGADRVRVLNNGVGLIDASAASPDHAVATEALEAERIEILRGPAAIAYGGGAIGGVVNVIDGRIPSEAPEDGLDGELYFGATSVDDGTTAAGRARFGFGNFVFQLEGLTREGDAYDIPGFSESAALRALEEEEEHEHDDGAPSVAFDEEDHEDEEEVFGFVENSDYSFDTGSVGVSFVGERGYIGASVRFTDANYGVPGGHHHHEEHEDEHDDGAPSIAFDEGDEEEEEIIRIDLQQTRYDIRGEYRFDGSVFERLIVSAGGADYKHVELEGEETGTIYDNEGWEARAEVRLAQMGRWTGAFGLQLSDSDFSSIGDEAFVPPSQTDEWGLFGVQRFDADSWGLEFGGRIENREISTAATTRDFDTQSFSGSIFWRPEDNTFMALTLSRSERAPTDIELFSDGPHLATQTFEIGDADLDVETGTSLEFILRKDFADGWSLEGAFFHAEYSDFIELFATGAEEDELPVFEFRQDDASLTGFEARVSGPLGVVAGWDVSGEVMAEYINAELNSGDALPRIPPFGLTAAVEIEKGAHEGRLEAVFADDVGQSAAFELPTEGYTLINARWSTRPFEDHDIRVILEGRNLTDEEARLNTSFLKDLLPLPGRNFRVGLSFGF